MEFRGYTCHRLAENIEHYHLNFVLLVTALVKLILINNQTYQHLHSLCLGSPNHEMSHNNSILRWFRTVSPEISGQDNWHSI